ncbi:MAG: hypothetical protein HY293_14155, partial [Planctomycetes bacterium]|nr:hypothetical protein [Planctomycetota bacterium]
MQVDRYALLLFSADELARVERSAAGLTLVREAEQALEKGWSRGAESMAVERWGLSRTREDEINETVARGLQALFLEKNEARAFELIRKAQEQSPGEEYCRLLGNWSSDAAKKAAWHDRALQIAPHFAAGYFDRGCARAVAGQVDGAFEDFTSTIVLDPRHLLAVGNRGVARQ